MNPNPFRMPNAPRLTIRQVLEWIVGLGSREAATSDALASRFDVTKGDACMRLLRLHRWGYLRRERGKDGSFTYTPTAFGRRTAKKWRAR